MKKVCIVCYFSAMAALYMLFFSVTAKAYIDPSALTYVIQVFAGLAVGSMTVLGVYWTKIKKAIKEALKVDLEAKKEVESDDIHVYY